MTRSTLQWLTQQPPLGMLKRWPIGSQAARSRRRAHRAAPRARLGHRNARKFACPEGHPYDLTIPGRGRACRQCTREQNRRTQQRHRERVRAAKGLKA